MYTTHHSCWDAKNRYSLPDEVPFTYESIRQILEPGAARAEERQEVRDTASTTCQTGRNGKTSGDSQ